MKNDLTNNHERKKYHPGQLRGQTSQFMSTQFCMDDKNIGARNLPQLTDCKLMFVIFVKYQLNVLYKVRYTCKYMNLMWICVNGCRTWSVAFTSPVVTGVSIPTSAVNSVFWNFFHELVKCHSFHLETRTLKWCNTS